MIFLRQAFIKSFESKIVLPESDINNDGQFTIADLVTLQRYLLGYKNL